MSERPPDLTWHLLLFVILILACQKHLMVLLSIAVEEIVSNDPGIEIITSRGSGLSKQ
jgi:hypothetical protein